MTVGWMSPPLGRTRTTSSSSSSRSPKTAPDRASSTPIDQTVGSAEVRTMSKRSSTAAS